ncbi:MAG TPA: glutaminyl-peptide cyclotransferase [Thermoanaerobaculia bacterium]|nr:glutaminyl-peptide cyclotransferase [Thermoanaerobaculia bacterium]
MRSLLVAVSAVLAISRSAPIAVTQNGGRVVVANPDSQSVSVVEDAKVAEVRLGATPQTLALLGNRAFVTTREGRVFVVDLDAQRVIASARVGTELFGIASDGARLFVSDYGAAAVRVLDAESLQPIASIATEEYPRGVTFADDAVYVTHLRTGRVSVIDATTLTVARVLATEADGNLAQSVTIANGRAYVPQTRANASNPGLLFDTTVFPVVSAIDLATGTSERFVLDEIDKPVNMPTDAVVTSSGKLYVVNAGSNDVSVIALAQKKKAAHVAVGANPRGIALSTDERTVYVTNALDGTVSFIDTATDAVVRTVPVTSIPLAPHVLNGKILFHSSAIETLAQDKWISCATCHFEGGTDGRTWIFRDGPRNTTALYGVLQTLPMHWSGDLDELQDVESTIRNVQAGTGLAHGEMNCTPSCDTAPPNRGRSQDLDDLAAYMTSLEAPHRELPQNARGAALFASSGCASCHTAPLYTDRKKHDVGTGTSARERKGSSFDTPSLRGVFDTAPYLHDGSVATLEELLATHGNAVLSASERKDLAEFLRSIPFPTTKRRSATSP